VSINVPELAAGSILIFTGYSALKKKHLNCKFLLPYNNMTFLPPIFSELALGKIRFIVGELSDKPG
jgi:hypothetical protein